MGKAEMIVLRVVVSLLVLLVIGAVVGGAIYGPRLNRALTAAAQGKADTVTTQAGADYQTATAADQAKTQAAEVAVTIQMQESTREVIASPGADALVSPDLYGAFADGVRRNRTVPVQAPGGPGAAGGDPAARTADVEP